MEASEKLISAEDFLKCLTVTTKHESIIIMK